MNCNNEFYKKKNKIRHSFTCMVYVFTFVMFLFSVMLIIFTSGASCHNLYTVTVTGKERISDYNNSKYLIFTEDENNNIRVFQNTDVWYAGKFNSSDLYAKIKVGETYTFGVIGYRIPWLSMYENIVSVE